MPLQNRVDPFGAIHAHPARGAFTGNRGVIHDPATRTLLSRRWTTKAWIVCDLVHPRAARRQPMGRNAPSGNAGWTELFFLDEVTALAAGHRPCFYCRREAARRFATTFAAGQGRASMTAAEIDAILQKERMASGGPAVPVEDIASLPDGAMVAIDGVPHALQAGHALAWSFEGYESPLPLAEIATPALLLTPPATIAALRQGYAPRWPSKHPP
jgi:hypothetical protein